MTIPDATPSYHVLVVDDDYAPRQATKSQLEHLGHKVDDAEGIEIGFGLFCRNAGEYDLIICDYDMLGGSGDDFAMLVEEDSPLTPFIILTANNEYRQSPDVDAVVFKPAKLGDIQTAIEQVMAMAAEKKVEAEAAVAEPTTPEGSCGCVDRCEGCCDDQENWDHHR